MSKVEVVHATSPLCHWSWGYEPVINRLRAMYGNQVAFTVGLGVPYTSRERWLEDYEMTSEEAMEFVREIVRAGGLPCHVPASWDEMPASCMPATVAVKAAGVAHGLDAERRLNRRLMHAFFVEGRDTSQDDVLVDAIRAEGLDLDAMLKASGEDADRALAEDAHRLGHGANFYSIVVRDGKGTSVSLEKAYDPARVERAIDYVAGKKLAKRKPTDVAAYVEEHGPVGTREVAVAFATTAAEAKTKLGALEKRGEIERRKYDTLPKETFWAAAE